ncbi:helix-turn-helix domain-containing protein [Nocardioides sp.]|uniref:helix-turn-helix transcriptional regulator n=1 Tax=Nocardioides sp. TaxID=35761 RepID=UPI003783E49C
MPRTDPTTVLTALGFSPAMERTYERVLRQSGQRLPWVAASVSRTPEDLLRDLAPLVERGIVRVVDDRVLVETPAQAVARLLVERSEDAARTNADLTALARAVPLLVAATARPRDDEVDDKRPIDGEITTGGNPALLIGALIRQSRGDLAWLRPDQWRIEREDAMLDVIRDLVAEGRRSRAIYPLRVLQEAPDVVRRRAEAGEQVRLLPEIPTRMFVIGSSHAVLPEPLGFVDEPRSLIRQQGLVEALLLLFEQLWDRAEPLAGSGEQDRSGVRRALLRQLADGAHDEQIARRLGISLRTVRRRVADLMSELGADTRFQAGVEAARRGWL